MALKGKELAVAFFAVVWILGAALLWHALSLDLWLNDTIGPGAYPVLILVGLLIVTTTLLLDALRTKEVRLLSPFQEGLSDDVRLKQVAARLSARTGQPIRVVSKAGEGRFSALWGILRAASDAQTLAVVSSDMTGLPNFHAAAFCRGNMEPIAGLFFDPDILVVRPDAPWHTPRDLLDPRAPHRLGFGHHPDLDHAVDRWFATRASLPFEAVYEDDPRALIRALQHGQLDAAVLGLSDVRGELARGELRGVGIMTEPSLVPTGSFPTTFTEQGLPVVSGRWAALMAPAGIDPERKRTLVSALAQVFREAPNGGEAATRAWSYLSPTEMERLLTAQARCRAEVQSDASPPAMPVGKEAGLTVAIVGLAAFPFVMPMIGFPATAFAYLLALMLLLWPRLSPGKVALSLAVAALLALGSHTLFAEIFHIVFPAPWLLEAVVS